MRLTVLGSGTVAPCANRTASAYWITAADTKLLLECGAGTLHRAAQYSIPWYQATHVAISHFHVDHWGELPALLFAMRWGVEPPRSEPLTLLGPPGLVPRIDGLVQAFGEWVLEPGFDLIVQELEFGAVLELGATTKIEAFKTHHTEQSVAYAVRDGDARLVYTADTGPDEGLARWASGCDLLLAECSLTDERAIEVHLTPTRAGNLARLAGARELVLTHFYPVFDGVDPAALAAAVFGGPVTAARDGDRFQIERDR